MINNIKKRSIDTISQRKYIQKMNHPPTTRTTDDDNDDNNEIGFITTATTRVNPTSSYYLHYYCCYYDHYYCCYHDDNADSCNSNQKDLITEPLLLPNSSSSTIPRTRNNCTTAILRLFYLMIGCIVGVISAMMGINRLLGKDDTNQPSSLVSSWYHKPQPLRFSSETTTATTTMLLLMPFYNTMVSFLVALMWSTLTIFVTFLTYVLLQCCIIRWMEPPRIETKKLDDTILCNGNVNVDINVDENNGITDNEYDQLMITVGACLGFTITCFTI